jgi:hypothetical protein
MLFLAIVTYDEIFSKGITYENREKEDLCSDS